MSTDFIVVVGVCDLEIHQGTVSCLDNHNLPLEVMGIAFKFVLDNISLWYIQYYKVWSLGGFSEHSIYKKSLDEADH